MAKNTTPSFVVTRRIITDDRGYDKLNKIMRITGRMYNAGVRHCIEQLNELKKDVWYKYCLSQFFACKDEKERKQWSREIFMCVAAYQLTEYDLHAYFGKGKNSGYEGGIVIDIVQKAATALYSAVKKAIFGKKIRFRKVEETLSFEGKKAISGVIYKPEADAIAVCGTVFKLKPVRKNDIWLQKAMRYKVKYCRIIREPFGIHYRFFLQLVMEGVPPQKHAIGAGTMAIDPGVSTMTSYNGSKLSFKELAPDVNKYQEKVVMEQNRLSKLTRINNPECYDDKGVHIKGMRIQYSESMKRAKMRLRTAYRKQRVYVEQSNNHLANEWLEASGSVVKIEAMNYKGLQKKSSKSERQDTESLITDKAGKKRSVRKFKRRKRFGGSILKHAPSGFLSTIKRKVEANCGIVIDVSALKLKASQYNHASDTYDKMSLSDREKIIDGHMVQRDCYSSFVIFYATNENELDREGCLNGFEKFLVCQDKLIEEMIHDNFSNQNFGTKLINIKKQQLREEPAAA